MKDYSKEYIEKKRLHLLGRLENKTSILKEGGQQAISHSKDDIRRIEFALKRIKGGQYGLCVGCGLPIETKRLDTIPETPFCAKCAENRQN